MANSANPFYVQPGGDYSKGLAGLGQAVGQLGERKREAEIKESAGKRFEQARTDITEAYKSGDPDKLMEVSFRYPEFQAVIKASLGTLERGAQNRQDRFVIDVLSDPNNAGDKYLRHIEELESNQRDSTHTKQSYEDLLKNPEAELKEMRMSLAASNPDAYKAMRDEEGDKASDFQQGTGDMSGSVFNPNDGTYTKSNLPPVPKGPDQKQTNVLRKDVFTLTKPMRLVETAYEKILNAEDTPAGDMSMIFGYMKMLDPGSTVREGEYATAQQTTGIPGQIVNAYNRAYSGERLNTTQREEFLSQGKGLYDAQRKTADSAIDNILQQADQDGIPRIKVLGAGRLSALNQRRSQGGAFDVETRGAQLRAEGLSDDQILDKLEEEGY